MVSDDTDHSIFVAQALARHPTDAEGFARCLAWRLRFWLLCLPAGIGIATLKSILRLWIGISPARSGVYSAGNGAAMRSAVIGVIHNEDAEMRRRFVSASSVMTHSDPKADFGAQAIAGLAALASLQGAKPTVSEVQAVLETAGEGDGWHEVVQRTVSACSSEAIEDALVPEGAERGVSGYIYHTLPAAVSAWYIHFGDFRKTIEAVARLGGDTDTVAAIAGSLAGTSVGKDGIPEDWLNHLGDFPHSLSYISKLSASVIEGSREGTRFSWLLLPRGILFTTVVLGHGFRRLLPPY